MDTKRTTSIGLVAGLCLATAACGGGSGDDTSTVATDPPITTENTAADTTATTDEAPTTAPATTAVTETPATDPPAPTTTDAPAPEPVSFDLATLPELLDSVVRATTDPTISPLSIARQLIGFPLEIPVPDGSRLYGISFNPYFAPEANRFEFGYDALGPDGVVPDIDITLEDNGPGSLQIIEIWDPIMAALGFERKNSTASDPGDAGGPNSVNHVYVAANPSVDFNGVPGEVAPVFVWSTEDINGWSYNAEREVLAGYSIDVDIETAPNAGIPAPIVNALLDLLPMPKGLELSDASVDLRNRTADSFDADKGLSYLEVLIEWEAPADVLDEMIEFLSDPTVLFPDEQSLMAGEDDFFNEGTIARTEWSDYGAADKHLELLLLQRYGAMLSINASSDGVEPMTVSFRLIANAVDQSLALPAE